jgi:hypothetical protein
LAAFLAQARTQSVHTDRASASGPQILQAWDMLHGNLLLHGWSVGDVSYYPTELPEYMVVEAVQGLNGDVVHVAAALTYTLIVLLGGLLAKGHATGRDAVVRFGVASGIMLAPTLLVGTKVLLSGPDHTGTQAALLAVWLVLDSTRRRWWVPMLVTVLLAWVLVADVLALYEGVLPLVVVCAVRMYRRRGPLAGQWYDLSLAAGALVSVGLARLVLYLIAHVGGFSIRTATVGFTTAPLLASQFWIKLGNILGLFGADFLGHSATSRIAIIALIHLVGLALVAWGAAAGLRRFFGGDLIVQLLTVAFVALLAAYLAGTRPNPNEMVGLLPIGAVLAGRVLGERLLRDGLVPALAVALACYGYVLVSSAFHPSASNLSNPPASWFEAHHLTSGLAGFAEAYSVSVLSGDRVHVSPVRFYNHELVTTPWENDITWFDPRRHRADFVIAPGGCSSTCPQKVDLFHVFGKPAQVYQLGIGQVLVWNKNLLPDVRILWWCTPNAWPWNADGKPSAEPCPSGF